MWLCICVCECMLYLHHERDSFVTDQWVSLGWSYVNAVCVSVRRWGVCETENVCVCVLAGLLLCVWLWCFVFPIMIWPREDLFWDSCLFWLTHDCVALLSEIPAAYCARSRHLVFPPEPHHYPSLPDRLGFSNHALRGPGEGLHWQTSGTKWHIQIQIVIWFIQYFVYSFKKLK